MTAAAIAPTVAVRPMSPHDADALVRFHEGLSDDTTRLRFFTQHRHLSGPEVERFTHVDHRDREALVAWSEGEIVGVGRYDRTADPSLAEVAFVVADEWQGRGVGKLLLQRLMTRARVSGIHHLYADTLGENVRMRRVFYDTGRVTDHHWDMGILHLVMDLDGTPPVRPHTEGVPA